MVYQADNSPDQDLEGYKQQLGGHLEGDTSLSDSLNAQFDLGIASTPTFRAVSTLVAKAQARSDEPLVPPKELNNRYPNVEIPFNEPLPESVAKFISHQQEIKQQMAETIQNGPKSKLLAPLNFVAGTAPALLDPIFLATGSEIAGVAEAAGLSKFITASEGAGFMESGLKGAAHAGAAMAGPEAISGLLAHDQQESYGLKDYFENVGSAAALSGALHLLPPAVRYLKGTLNGKPDQLAQTVATSQMLRGKNVEVTPIVSQLAGETDGNVVPPPDFFTTTNYQYKPIDTSAPVTGKFYHGSENSLGDIKTVDRPILEHDLGPGIYLTDSPHVANGVAARGMAEAPGKVIEADLKDAKLLDLEQPLPGGDSSVPAKEAFAQMSPEARDTLEATLKAQGYDGYRMEGGKFLGEENAPHNIVKLFDPENEKLTQTGELTPSAEVTKQPTEGELQAISDHQQSPESERLFDKSEAEAFQAHLNHPAEETELNDAKVKHQDEMDSLREIANQGHLDPASKAEWKALEEDAKQAPEKEAAWKSYMNCLVGKLYG